MSAPRIDATDAVRQNTARLSIGGTYEPAQFSTPTFAEGAVLLGRQYEDTLVIVRFEYTLPPNIRSA